MKSYAVFAIIYGVGGFPLVKDKDKPWKWKLPGGSSETEHPEDALMREIVEEVGIVLMPNPKEVYRVSKDTHDTVFYAADYYDGELKAGDELEAMGTFFVDELAELVQSGQVFHHHAVALAKHFGFTYF